MRNKPLDDQHGCVHTDFVRFTADTLGVDPSDSNFRISSSSVRKTAVFFTLAARMCDCASFIGLGNARPVAGEISAEAWLTWLHDIPTHSPFATRIGVMRTWNPSEDVVVPAHERNILINEITEQTLRDAREDDFLMIDYPKPI